MSACPVGSAPAGNGANCLSAQYALVFPAVEKWLYDEFHNDWRESFTCMRTSLCALKSYFHAQCLL